MPSSVKQILPAEHGSWGLVGEPVVLGLLVAFSPAGLLVALGSFAGFLVHRPAKLAGGDRRKGRRYPRTVLAERFAAAFGLGGAASLAGALALAGPALLLPFALALPLAALFVVYDLRPGRSWQAELAAPAAFASAAAAIALASGWSAPAALALWAVMVCRSVPSVLYVRERVRLERNGTLRPKVLRATAIAHAASIVLAAALVAAELLPVLALVAVAVLAARAGHGLTWMRFGRTARAVGFQEIGWGAVTVLLVAMGYWTGV